MHMEYCVTFPKHQILLLSDAASLPIENGNSPSTQQVDHSSTESQLHNDNDERSGNDGQ
jgi:hypothetical protein